MSDAAYFTEMEAKIPTGKVRTRFAPSPTGYMHIGNLRTALYTWLIARSHGGTFILRIEDTDQGRLVEGATDVIYRTMAECHLNHDEGPDIGGPVAPYIQSQRRDTYGKYARLLAEKGGAYYCFCEKCASEEDTGDFDRADDPCRDLLLEDALRRVEAGEPYVIRQRIPKEGTTTFHDAVFGDISVENSTLDDQVLLKRDGLPTYNFANVIDDHLMGITHVVRGSEYLSSAPKYDLLYHAFGWEVPTYVHCSPVMRDAQNKMSKRHGDPSYEDLKAEGYLTDAILNYVALLGWSPKGELAEQEIFSLDALVKAFDLTGISKSPAIFDKAKLDHFNAVYLRAMSPEDFAKAAEPYIRQSVKGDFDDAYADFGNGTLGAVNFGFGYPGQFRDFFKSAWLAVHPDASIDDLAVGQALTSNGSYGKTYSTGTWINSHYFIPTSCAYPDRVLDLVEFLASNAGQDLLHNCVNGEFNTSVGSDYWSAIDGAYGYGDGRCKYVWFSYMFSGVEYYCDFENQSWWDAVSHPVDFSNSWATEEDAALVSKAKDTISGFVNEVVQPLPAYYNMVALPAEATDIINQLTTITNEYLTQFIGGQLDIDASWGDYAAAYEAAGAAELETMINDAVATARTTYGG